MIKNLIWTHCKYFVKIHFIPFTPANTDFTYTAEKKSFIEYNFFFLSLTCFIKESLACCEFWLKGKKKIKENKKILLKSSGPPGGGVSFKTDAKKKKKKHSL